LLKKNKAYEHKFLALIFFLITINSVYVFQFFRSARTEDFYYVPFFSELNYAIPLLYGPLLWFYTRALTQKNFTIAGKDYLHFIPFIVFFLVILSPQFLDVGFLESKQVGYPLLKLILTPFYLFSVLLLLNKYRAQLLNAISYEHKVNLYWLSWITVGAIALWVIAVGGFIFNEMNDNKTPLLYDYYVTSFLGVFLFVLGIVAFARTDIFTRNAEEPLVPEKIIFEDETVIETVIETSQDGELQQLKEVMTKEKPFLDPLLSISKLAEVAKIPQYKISKMLNTALNQNFYDFVNGYRIEEVKQRLKDGEAEQYSILGIATECGFNSKASFNRVFKKIVKMTPTAYLKSLD